MDKVMKVTLVPAILDFEVYLLMTMRLRIKMSHKERELEIKLGEHGLSVDDAERIGKKITDVLGDEASYFGNMKKLLEITDKDVKSLQYTSILWPGFEFQAITREDGLLESARYRHTRREPPSVDSPTEISIWSMDVDEFTERFGPMRRGRQWPLLDKFLPAYEEYEFLWGGDSYGAGFSWGLFVFSAMSWD